MKTNERTIKNEACLEYVKEKVDRIEKTDLPNKVDLIRFTPIEKIVYSLVGLILVGVVTALINLVLK
jgi:hypothetical protein